MELEVKLNENEKFTEYTILRSIRDYYQQNMTKEELEDVAYNTNDGWGYSELAEKALSNNKPLKRGKVMGDCKYFEHLKPIKVDKNEAHYSIFIGT